MIETTSVHLFALLTPWLHKFLIRDWCGQTTSSKNAYMFRQIGNDPHR